MLTGGTAGQQTKDNENGSMFGSFTRDGVKTIYASPRKTYDVRILPAFDMSLNIEDESFSKSFVSYRNREDDPDEDTKSEAFNAWFYMVEGYTYIGFGRKQFLSPLTGTKYFPAGHDPIRDTWVYIDKNVNDVKIKQMAQGRTVIDSDSGREKKLQGYLSKTPRTFAMMNVLVEGDVRGQWENAVMVVSFSTMLDLKKQLCEMSPRSSNVVITKEWPDYLYGDITDPAAGCIARVQEKAMTTSKGGSIKTCGFFLEQAPDDISNNRMLARPVTEAELEGRYRIFDTENVTNLPCKEEQYQVILDYLVEDGVVPLSILEAACGKYGKINYDLRVRACSWWEGEAPLEDSSRPAHTVDAPVKEPETSTKTSAESVASNLAATKAAEPDPIDEDVPMEYTPPVAASKPEIVEEPPANESEAPKGAQTTEQARFAELQEKLKNNEPLEPAELQELGELAQKGVGA